MMVNNLEYSAKGLSLTQQFEGLKLTSYQDVGGVWTIGFGHTGPDVHADMTCTQEQADAWLQEDVAGAVYVVNKVVTVPLNQNQFDALVDFVYNLGSGNFQSSTLLKDLNSGDYAGAANQFQQWDHAGGKVVAGLLARRCSEQVLFQTDPAVVATPAAEPSSTPANIPTSLMAAANEIQKFQSWIEALQNKFNPQ